MYSVEDLLISHGYKPRRDLPVPRGPKADGRHAQAKTRTTGGQGLQNGCEDGAAALAPSRLAPGPGPVRAPEAHRSTPRCHTEHHRTSASGAPEAGFCNQPALAWSSQPRIGHDQACRRRGQKASSSQGPRDRGELEGRGMAQARSLPVPVREGPWEVGGRTEHVMKKAVWEEEPRMSSAAKWQNTSFGSWDQPRKLGRQMSDGDGERLFQDLYPFIQGEHTLTSQNKKKSQSLPRVLSPESLSSMEIPIELSVGHLPGVPRVAPYPPSCAPHSELTKNSGKAGSSAPFPRPKFGRPLKPPSYSSHPQPRGGERGSLQDGQQMDLRGPCFPRASEPRSEPSVPDWSLEPPVYVPPPSYRSPPLHIPNPYLEDTTPKHTSGGHSPQNHPTEKPSVSIPLPSGLLRTGNEYGASPGSPRSPHPHPRPVATCEGSVQYIPFDDPRIRHIRLAQPLGFGEQVKPDDRPYDTCPVSPPEPAQRKRRCDGAILNAQSLTLTSGNEKGPALVDPGPQWLWGQLPGDGEHAHSPDRRDHCFSRGQQASGEGGQHGHTGSHIFSSDPQGERTCEAHTKLRMFETGMQTKKSSKKKANETIFCLVSIPVKSESHLPEIDTNNNDLKQSADKKPGLDKSLALQEQSLLSMSSTDLELQALTGSMAEKTGFPTQDLGEPEGDRQTDDLRFVHLAEHRALKYSGSWPGHQYRDQQTQTSFPEDSQGLQLLPASRPGELSETAPKCVDPTASDIQGHATPGSRDPKRKGQMPLSPSGRSAFSRTSPSTTQAPVPRAGQGQPCMDVCGQGASPVPKPEVVKGEPTAGPCNSKQLFGQFLLKPVSRRPWDLISQLESFNKELQEEEGSPDGSSGGSSEENEIEQRLEDDVGAGPKSWGFHEDSREKRVAPGHLVPDDPGCWSGRAKSGSESGDLRAGLPLARPPSPSFSQVQGGQGELFRSAARSLVTETWKQEIVNGTDELSVSPGPMESAVSSRPRHTEPVPPAWLAAPRGPAAESEKLGNTLGSVLRLRAVPPEERAAGPPLTLTDKSRGLSAPDLRSVGLVTRPEPSASELDRPPGEGSVADVPPSPSESLQARAARILGIEVAMEALLPGAGAAGPSLSPELDAGARSLELPRDGPLPTVSADAFYGRRKCGWTQSPLFVGERAPQASGHAAVDGALTSLEPWAPEQENTGPKPSFRSTLFHAIERTPSVAGLEKRLRSPSKVIESLQEKLASPPRRAAPDRLMRMKEVSSVSRMRSLSFRSTDSAEEAEDTKAGRGQAWQPLSGGARAGRAGHLPSLSRGSISGEENRPAAAASRRPEPQDFWCPDSYDPSRVERV